MNDLLGQISGVPIQSELRVDALDLFDDGNSYLGPSSEIVQSSRSVYAQSASIDVSEISCTSTMSTLDKSQLAEYKKSYIEIIDQPQAKAVRFRYECEGRSAGSIPGCKTSAENKTYPTIKVVGKKGPATVVVSCVTVDPPYKPHPHSVVGREGHCKDGICRVDINEETMTCSFPYIGIQCKKKKDVADALRERERLKVDPFRTGFSHKDQPQNIDLNCVRLCFQVFYKLPGCFHELNPVVSNPIFDKKATTELVITKISHCSGSVCGGEDVILLCDKVPKDDIDIRFFEMDQSGKIVWEDKADFQPANVHKQYAIVFKTPRYKNIDIQNNVKVKMQLVKRSDKSTSAPVDYEYLASESGGDLKRKRNDNFNRIMSHIGLVTDQVNIGIGLPPPPSQSPSTSAHTSGRSFLSPKYASTIKTEPTDKLFSTPPQNIASPPHNIFSPSPSSNMMYVPIPSPNPQIPLSTSPNPSYHHSPSVTHHPQSPNPVYLSSLSPNPSYIAPSPTATYISTSPTNQIYQSQVSQQYYPPIVTTEPGTFQEFSSPMYQGMEQGISVSVATNPVSSLPLSSTHFLSPQGPQVESVSPTHLASVSPAMLTNLDQLDNRESISLHENNVDTSDLSFLSNDQSMHNLSQIEQHLQLNNNLESLHLVDVPSYNQLTCENTTSQVNFTPNISVDPNQNKL